MSCAGRVEAPQPRDENNNMTLYQPIHRNGMAGLPHDTMTGANIWILKNGGFNLWRVELTAVESQLPRPEADRPFPPIRPPQRVDIEVREFSPEIKAEMAAIKARSLSESTMTEARNARLRLQREG